MPERQRARIDDDATGSRDGAILQQRARAGLAEHRGARDLGVRAQGEVADREHLDLVGAEGDGTRVMVGWMVFVPPTESTLPLAMVNVLAPPAVSWL